MDADRISDMELDILILAIFRAAARRLHVGDDVKTEAARFYRTQVLIDEATDFSPIQLACMAETADPVLRAVFACGDLNQRTTEHGTRTEEDLKWALGERLDVRRVAVTYRQTQQMLDFARAIVRAAGGQAPDAQLPSGASTEGPSPVLAENVAEVNATAEWLVHRIREVKGVVGALPSVAVFAPSEEAVAPLRNRLRELLHNENDARAIQVRGIQRVKGPGVRGGVLYWGR